MLLCLLSFLVFVAEMCHRTAGLEFCRRGGGGVSGRKARTIAKGPEQEGC